MDMIVVERGRECISKIGKYIQYKPDFWSLLPAPPYFPSASQEEVQIPFYLLTPSHFLIF